MQETKSTPQEIANEMRRLRKVLKLGVREMAENVSVSPATLSRVENYKEVSVETAKAILPFAGACLCCGRPWVGQKQEGGSE